MKKILLIVFCFVSVTGIAQSKKVKQVTKKTTQLHVKEIDTLELVKTKAIEWFKDVYVEQNFKDPYNYQPLKTTVDKVTLEKSLLSQINNCRSKIAELETDHSIDYLNGYYNVELKFYNDYLEKAKNEDDPIYKKELLKLAQDTYDSMQPIKVKIDAANHENKLINATQNLLDSLSDIDKQSTLYYLIHHDTLLGSYVFKFDLKKNKGYDVVNLNSDNP